MKSNSEKGNALEKAVAAIEQNCLKVNASYFNKPFTIKTKRIVFLNNGVRNEFDVWVEIAVDDSQVDIIVFECKNWSRKIGLKEVNHFYMKVNDVGAKMGFMVGTSFTKSAMCQAARFQTLSLLKAKNLPINLKIPFEFHFLEVVTKKVFSNGNELKLSLYPPHYFDSVIFEGLKNFNSVNLPSHKAHVFAFDYNNGSEKLHFELNIEVHRNSIKYHFDIESSGRYLELENIITPTTKHKLESNVTMVGDMIDKALSEDNVMLRLSLINS